MKLIRLGCAAAFLAMVLLPVSAQAQGKKAAPKEDSFFSGPPFTLADILQRVGIIADKRLATAIERRGIGFAPAPADYDRLQQAGASAEVLGAIRAKAPAPPPAPRPQPKPQPPPRAALLLECAPADCEVVVNGKPRGRTLEGKLALRDLPAGHAVVDFHKEGYEGQQVELDLIAGSPVTRAVSLKPTPATQGEVGKMLFARMVDRLGGDAALRLASSLSASGNASLWQAGGQRTEWEVSCKLKLPDLAMIEISGAKQKWWTSLKGSDSKADGTKKMAGGAVALEMEKLVRLYRNYQLAALVSQLRGMRIIAPAAAPDEDGGWRLHATSPECAYQIKLGKDGAPLRIVYESPSGLGSGLQVLYGDYSAERPPSLTSSPVSVWYPKSMTIRYAEQAQHGIELHFSQVEFTSKLTDKDFHR